LTESAVVKRNFFEKHELKFKRPLSAGTFYIFKPKENDLDTLGFYPPFSSHFIDFVTKEKESSHKKLSILDVQITMLLQNLFILELILIIYKLFDFSHLK
jgi:hypothetical protein